MNKDKKNIKIVALGDSITQGFPFTLRDSWVEIASKELKVDIINKGINGDTTEDMLNRFEKDVISLKPTHVIILGGANDAYCGVDKEIVFNNLKTMCQLAVAENITPIIGLPTPSNEPREEYRLSAYRRLYEGYAQANGYAIIDFYQALVDPATGEIKVGLDVDGIHPSIQGYSVMAAVLTLGNYWDS